MEKIYENEQWYFDAEGMHSKEPHRTYFIEADDLVRDGDWIDHLAAKVWVKVPLAIDCYLRALHYYKEGSLPQNF